jgi:protein-export membrane protein SecD
MNDPQRAKELVGKTARLDFLLVKTRQELFQALTRVDQAVARRSGDFQAALDSLMADGDSTLAADSTAVDSLLAGASAFSSLFTSAGGDVGIAYCPAANYGRAKAILSRVIGDPFLERPAPLAGGTLLLWGEEVFGEAGGQPGRYLYAVTDRAELTGDNVAQADVAFGLDTTNPNVAGVSLTFDKRGAAVFTRMTGNNVGRQLAIVLDHTVKSAPVIRDKIRGGRASITGLDSDEEAQDLKIVLRAGALPTDLVLQEQRAVSSTLGRDSINQGVRASLVGLALVVLTMLIYYRLSGILAILALIGNLFFLFSTLGMLRGTLTMPGIAGIVLTIGMAVDANVLIFERIREEIRTGKTVRGAIEAGYKSAFRTILDSNITTLISAVVLFQFGTGPIKGFALTLMIGIVANVFTAVFVTRLIYDSVMANRPIKKLSI